MGKAHRKSIIYEAILRLDEKMAVGEHPYLEACLPDGQAVWVVDPNKMYSHETPTRYQEVVLSFVSWARAQSAIWQLDALDRSASVQVCLYLEEQRIQGVPLSILRTVRAALRLFFADQSLAEGMLSAE
jgi:hypothetical protein